MNREFTIGGVAFNLQLTLVIIFTTIVPMIDAYDHSLFGVKAYDRFVFYFVLPIMLIVWLFREDPQQYGLQIGRWREGVLWTLAAIGVMALILWFFAQLPGVQAYYSARAASSTALIIFRSAVELFAWEFIWRGLLLFTLARYLGPGPAIFLQAVPFAFMHLGKPEIETLSTIFGGAGFGYVAWRSQSFLYGWLIHWFMAAFTLLLSSGGV